MVCKKKKKVVQLMNLLYVLAMVCSEGDLLKTNYVHNCPFFPFSFLVTAYFSMNSILGVQCHNIKKSLFFVNQRNRMYSRIVQKRHGTKLFKNRSNG